MAKSKKEIDAIVEQGVKDFKAGKFKSLDEAVSKTQAKTKRRKNK